VRAGRAAPVATDGRLVRANQAASVARDGRGIRAVQVASVARAGRVVQAVQVAKVVPEDRAVPAGQGIPGIRGVRVPATCAVRAGHITAPTTAACGPTRAWWSSLRKLRSPPSRMTGPTPPPEDPAFDDGADNAAVEGEVPPTLAGTIGRLPAAQRPAYIALGAITSALRDPRATGAGFYLIEFTVNGVQRAYSGQTGNLHRRLQQHALCGQMMGLPLSAHSVYVAPSGLQDAQRRAIEYRIHDDMFRTSAGVLTNQRRELEAELFGNEWR
jgi:hypothetical protein